MAYYKWGALVLLGYCISCFSAGLSTIKDSEVHHGTYHKVSLSKEEISKKFNHVLDKITPSKRSALLDRLQQEADIIKNKYVLGFFEPTYILPFYYTADPSPYYAAHPGSTPDNLKVENTEFKGQFSFIFPLWIDMFKSQMSLNASYTQVMYWQVYCESPYFRETNYEPRLFISYPFHRNWLFNIGIDHQSNGRGGEGHDGMERSWNRAFMDIAFSGPNWTVILEPWVPILTHWSADLHNSNITDYLGYGRIIYAYRFHRQEVDFMMRNVFESGFSRGALQLSYAFPLHGYIKGYVQLFSGYGQSLIEYDHYTNSIGLGIALSTWL